MARIKGHKEDTIIDWIRLVRKTLAFSKAVGMYRAAPAWEDLVYNLAQPLKTLRLEVFDDPRRRWKQRAPAMASGLTDHIWTVKELLILHWSV